MDLINVLRGEDLYIYLRDEKKCELIELLIFAVRSIQEAGKISEKIVDENRQLIAVYPFLNQKATPDMELI